MTKKQKNDLLGIAKQQSKLIDELLKMLSETQDRLELLEKTMKATTMLEEQQNA